MVRDGKRTRTMTQRTRAPMNGRISFTTFTGSTLPMDEPMYMSIPTGGVMSPIVQTIMVRTQYWTISIPAAAIAGAMIGAMTYMIIV